jgi:hypothetical protein
VLGEPRRARMDSDLSMRGVRGPIERPDARMRLRDTGHRVHTKIPVFIVPPWHTPASCLTVKLWLICKNNHEGCRPADPETPGTPHC